MIVTNGITTIDLTRPQQTIDGKWYVAAKKNARGLAVLREVEMRGIVTPPKNRVYEQKKNLAKEQGGEFS